MSEFLEIRKAVEKTATAFEEFKKTNDERLEALKKGDEARASELDETLTRIEADITKYAKFKEELEADLQLQRERIEEIEARGSKPGKTAETRHAQDYSEAFDGWIRSGCKDTSFEQRMRDAMSQAREQRDVTVATDTSGGYAVPEVISREIQRLERKFSPVMEDVKVVQVSAMEYKELISIGGQVSAWVGETDARRKTATSQLREVQPTFGELYAYPKASEWSLDDMLFDVAGWLVDETAQTFAINIAEAVISGNGTKKPTGMLNTASTKVADDAGSKRAAAVFEHVDSKTVVKADALFDVVYKLNSRYRGTAHWTMNSMTQGIVRKLKDGQDNYLWQPGLAAGQPSTLLGYRVSSWEQMADVGSNNLPIGFGDFKRAYTIADRTGTRISRHDQAEPGFVSFYIRRRLGGIPANNDAVKFVKTIP